LFNRKFYSQKNRFNFETVFYAVGYQIKKSTFSGLQGIGASVYFDASIQTLEEKLEVRRSLYVDQAVKAEVKKEYQKHDRDTGSVEVQVALMSGRISELTEHLKTHKKDNSTRRGLITLVNKRRKLLSYLAKEDDARYKELIQRLGLRR